MEEQFQNGALAQQAMLEEKEALAQNLHGEVNCRTLSILVNDNGIFIHILVSLQHYLFTYKADWSDSKISSSLLHYNEAIYLSYIRLDQLIRPDVN